MEIESLVVSSVSKDCIRLQTIERISVIVPVNDEVWIALVQHIEIGSGIIILLVWNHHRPCHSCYSPGSLRP